MEFKQIQELIKLVGKSEIGEIKIKDGDFQISMRSNSYIQSIQNGRMAPVVSAPAAMPVQAASTAQPAQAAQSATESAPTAEEKSAKGAEGPKEDKGTVMKSPMIGTFYRSPSPDKDPFVKVGDSVQKGDVLCIIEAMKLFNEIESEFTGKIVKVLVEDNSPVEYDQPLFLIDTNA